MEYITIQDAAERWGISERRIQVLCSEGRLKGAVKFGRQWAIPSDTNKPDDARIKSGKYIKHSVGNTEQGVNYMQRKPPVIFSFFSGSGFLDLGFETHGFLIDLVNEFQPAFLDAYKYARNRMGLRTPKYGYFNIDINEFLGSRKDELHSYIEKSRLEGHMVGFIGGPPCPDFSVAGKNKGREGDNGKLSKSYVDLIVEMQPDFFLFENVKGLWRTARHRAFFEELKTELVAAKYETTERLTNALEYGAPQDRDRILLFGIKRDFLGKASVSDFGWKKYQSYDLETIKKIKWPDVDPFVPDSITECPAEVIKEITVQYWFEKNDVENHPNASDYFIPRTGLARMQTINEGDVSKKSYKRLHRWRFSPTVAYGNNEVHLHPYRVRRISAAEAMALQSLPKAFALPPKMTLSNKFKTIGNGVPYALSSGIACTIMDFLEGLK
ncbi:dNA (Cytosine-5-)-methyltransferase [Firmicutes bacterium CAG:240]|jgi:DNA (cytosine-5)-methyltransferase 1|nr:dNA (Cytosine-5-)-methyltransferase [Firmicutes bacterium CAG:240]